MCRYGAAEGGRRRPSGSVGESSGGRSEPGGPSALSGASAERRISHSLSGRRVTRPVLHESSAHSILPIGKTFSICLGIILRRMYRIIS